MKGILHFFVEFVSTMRKQGVK